jgi:hypothetical protein
MIANNSFEPNAQQGSLDHALDRSTRNSGALRIQILAIIFLLTACTADAKKLKVDGAGEFCVPHQFTVAAPWWIPEDKPGTPQGFAFAGCWHAKPDKQACPFPDSVISGTVHGANHSSTLLYGSFPADSFIRSVLREHDTKFEQYDSGAIVSAQNLRLWQAWYVWGLGTPAIPGQPITFSANDRLIATCHFADSIYKPTSGGPQNIFCGRDIDHGPLKVHYSFESSEVLPRDVASMDSAIISTIKSWQCEQNPSAAFNASR